MKVSEMEARVAYRASHSGDGYGYGGGAVLVVGNIAVDFGEHRDAQSVAERIAFLWNADLASTLSKEQEQSDAHLR